MSSARANSWFPPVRASALNPGGNLNRSPPDPPDPPSSAFQSHFPPLLSASSAPAKLATRQTSPVKETATVVNVAGSTTSISLSGVTLTTDVVMTQTEEISSPTAETRSDN